LRKHRGQQHAGLAGLLTECDGNADSYNCQDVVGFAIFERENARRRDRGVDYDRFEGGNIFDRGPTHSSGYLNSPC